MQIGNGDHEAMSIRRMICDLSIGRLRQVLDYDAATGLFRWRARLSKRVRIGDVAGVIFGKGHIQIRIDRRLYCAHRLAWLYTHGEWPRKYIDHINGDPADNRIGNLREADHGQNNANSRGRAPVSGLKGAYRNGLQWRAVIRKDGLQVHLGNFSRPEEAHAAYMKAAAIFHGEFANSGERIDR